MKERSNGPTRDVTVLFVEDDANEILLFSRALSKAQIAAAALFVQTPQELHDYVLGIGKFSDRRKFPVPEMILTDYRLCGGSAKDVLQSVRCSEQFRDIPVVVFSSYVPQREIEAILTAGAKACIEKPLELSGFTEVLQYALRFARN